MKEKSLDKKIVALFIASFGMYAFLTMSQYINGKFCILAGDLLEIYVPAIKTFYKGVLSGDRLLFSFSTSFGINTSLYYAFYSVLCPLNILFAFDIDPGTVVIILLIIRAGVTAFSFQYFAEKTLKIDNWMTVGFSLFYSLCSFQLAYNTTNIIWMEALFLLPLVITFLIEFVGTGKWIKLCLSLAYKFVTNFYMGYMIGIYVFLVFVLYLFVIYRKEYAKKIVGFCLSVVLAAGMCAFILVPTALFLINGYADDATAFSGLNCNIIDVLNQLFIGENNGMDGIYPYIYCGIPCIFLCVLYFINKEIPRLQRIITAIILAVLVLSCIIGGLYIAWHAFDAPDSWGYRFSYLISFTLCAISCMQINKANEIKLRWYIIIGVLCIAVFIFELFFQNQYYFNASSNTLSLLTINVIFICIWIVLFSVKKNSNVVLFSFIAIAFVEILVNGFYLVYGRDDTRPSVRNEFYNNWVNSEEYMLQALKDDNDLYRVNYTNDYSHNSDSLFGYNGVSDFGTVENYKLRQFLSKLGIFTSPRIIYPYGYTDFTNMLMGVKYDVDGVSPYGTSNYNEPIINSNKYYSGMGFVVPKEVQNISIENNNVYENMNILASAMAGEDIRLFEKCDEVEYVEVGINYQKREEDYLLIGEETEGLKAIQFTIPYDGRKAYCTFDCGYSVMVDNCPYFYGGEENLVFLTGKMGVIYAKEMIVNDNKNTVTICMDDNTYQGIVYRNAYYYYYNKEEMNKLYSLMFENDISKLQVEEYSNGYLKGNIYAADNASLLYTSIPYAKGWKAYIDGVETDITPLFDDALIGIKLDEGKHEIVLSYVAPGSRVGVIISVLSIITMVSIVIYYKKKNKNCN